MSTEAAFTPTAAADAIFDGVDACGLSQSAKGAVYLAFGVFCDSLIASKAVIARSGLSRDDQRAACRALSVAIRQAMSASEIELEAAIARGDL